jgi:hypothetical protein
MLVSFALLGLASADNGCMTASDTSTMLDVGDETYVYVFHNPTLTSPR